MLKTNMRPRTIDRDLNRHHFVALNAINDLAPLIDTPAEVALLLDLTWTEVVLADTYATHLHGAELVGNVTPGVGVDCASSCVLSKLLRVVPNQ